jgi:hypothetical protein
VKRNRTWTKAVFSILIAAAAGSSWTALPLQAEAAAYQRDQLEEAARLPALAVGAGAAFELKNAVIVPTENGNMLFFTITVDNSGSRRALSFLDYWVRPETAAGLQFEAQLIPQDKAKKEIPAGQRVDFSFYAPVNEGTALSELGFRVTRWNYASKSLEDTVGMISFPEEAQPILTESAASRTLAFGSFAVDAEVTRWHLQPREQYASGVMTLKLTNRGQVGLKLPGLQFSLKTASGLLYPLEPVIPSDKQLLTPHVPVQLQLKGSMLPADAMQGGLELLIQQPTAITSEQKLNVPVAALFVPDAQEQAAALGDPVTYTNLTGTYFLQVEKLQRLPWEDVDILSAEVALSHHEGEALPFPAIKPYFLLDNGVKVEAKAVMVDRALGVPAEKQVHMQMVAKIPYTYPFSTAQLVLQESGDSAVSQEIGRFLLPIEGQAIQQIPLGVKQPILGSGRQARYAPYHVNTYVNSNSKLVEVQVDAENMEKRAAPVPKLTAFLKTPSDQLFPTKVKEVKQKLNPSGHALVGFTAVVPRDMDTTNLSLLIGESVTDQHWSGTEEKPELYLNAVEMALPQEPDGPKDSLKAIQFYPYTLTLSNLTTWLDSKELKVQFRYLLERDYYFEKNTDGSKLIIEFEDNKGQVSISESFYLETAPEDKDRKMTVGEYEYKMVKQDNNLIYRVSQLKQYKINVYHELDGKKKLLASKAIDWFTIMD